MDKVNGLKELRFLISCLEPDILEEAELKRLLGAARKAVCKNGPNPVFQVNGFLCFLNRASTDGCFQVDVTIMDPQNPFPSQKEIEKIMGHYGVHGVAWYSVRFDKAGNPSRISLSVTSSEEQNTIMKPCPLTLKQVCILNLKAEGRTQAEIARVENCSESSVVYTLHMILQKTNRYGFRQVWPEGVKMQFSENEYFRALRSRGKSKKPAGTGDKKGRRSDS